MPKYGPVYVWTWKGARGTLSDPDRPLTDAERGQVAEGLLRLQHDLITTKHQVDLMGLKGPQIRSQLLKVAWSVDLIVNGVSLDRPGRKPIKDLSLERACEITWAVRMIRSRVGDSLQHIVDTKKLSTEGMRGWPGKRPDRPERL